MYKTVRDHLEAYSGQSVDINYSKLYNKFASAIETADSEDLQKEFEYRSARQLHARHIDVMKKIVAEELEKEVERVNGSLPVASVFEALQIAKRAHDELKNRDHGLSNFVGYLETKWKHNRDASITASDYLNMREHFSNNFPKSKVGAVIDAIGHKGYATLPMTDLMEIASRIASQEDFEREILNAGLGGNNPHQKKARRFILALINAPATPAEEEILQEVQNTSPTEIGEGIDKGFGEGTLDLSNLSPDEIMALISQLEEQLQVAQETGDQEVMNVAGSALRQLKAAVKTAQAPQLEMDWGDDAWMMDEENERYANPPKWNMKMVDKLLSDLRKRQPDTYTQLVSGPFGFPPSYAQENPTSDWWVENQDALDGINDSL